MYLVNNTLNNGPRKKEAKERGPRQRTGTHLSQKKTGKSARGHLSKQYLRDTKFQAGKYREHHSWGKAEV